MTSSKNAGSFRDPAGFIFHHSNKVYRQVNQVGQTDYDHFMSSGLYQKLVDKGLLVAHKEVNSLEGLPKDDRRYKLLLPDQLPFISYPYEWSFSMLKDAAKLTLRIQKLALKHGMILKDASAYNVQFVGKQPLFIDTLSFAIYKEGDPWEGYKQFCEHFIAPLALASYTTPLTQRMLRDFLDGIPLQLVTSLLPRRARLQRGLLAHLYLHASSQRKHQGGGSTPKPRKVSAFAMQGLMSSLSTTIGKLKLRTKDTEWGEYYSFTNYSDKAFQAKKKLVDNFIGQVKGAKQLWDVGANNGEFSSLGAAQGLNTVAWDIDVLAVEYNYVTPRDEQIDSHMLPLVQDLTNPSPGLGMSGTERDSLAARGPADIVMALALIHHLAIGANVPLDRVAEFMHSIAKHLIIEWVPKGDSKVDHLLASRRDIFEDYDQKAFEQVMSQYFKQVDKQPVKGSKRTLYLYKRK